MRFQDKPLRQQVKEIIEIARADGVGDFDGTDIWPLIDRISELEAKINRLTSRGFEDLHHENEQLKAKLDRVQNAADELAEALADD